MNDRAQSDPLTVCCYFEELRIRARSAWHRDQYNLELEHANSLGLAPTAARVYAIQKMAPSMRESRIRPVAID